jgi:uncharacterized repeat protein (TIGR01451 family)
MRSKITLFCLLIVLSFGSKAQTYVTIPDTNFVSYLQTNFSACMSGNQMDTSCPSIQSAGYLVVSFLNIYDLTGLEYFSNITYLDCSYNILTSLPVLPGQLQALDCGNNLLTSLPPLPNALCSLYCNNNQLTSLPTLPPNSIDPYGYGFSLDCGDNQLTALPELPQMLSTLVCDNNNITCFPTLPNNAYYYEFSGNPFTCLPNHTPAMNATLLAYPICIDGDTVNNPDNCQESNGILGIAYRDVNSNCMMESTDTAINNIPFKIYDSSNNLLGSTYSFSNGTYHFIQPSGTYRVELDTTGRPFTTNCFYPGVDTMVVVPSGNPLVNGVNFDIACKTGFDIGVQSVYRNGIVFPGQNHTLHVMAGDMIQWFGLNCAAGVSGQVEVTVTGPATYVGPVAGSMVPVVAGNVFTYAISDFGAINNSQAFSILLNTNTAAVAGDQMCITVVVTPTSGDNNASNNTTTYCYPVVNSYDPNMKEVYPVDVEPGFEDWFTYTIHFQNTGTAAAINIRLEDTLDANLDFSTFQVINYSHFNTASLINNALAFYFPNIQLPDSTSDLEGSKGFVQYRIKPLAGLVTGTTIENTANIYFDYNPAVVTNTTVNEFVSALAVNENKPGKLNVYPNPGTGKYVIELSDGSGNSGFNIEVYNLIGELVLSTRSTSDHTSVDLSAQPDGIYFVKVNGSKRSFNQRIVKQ